MASCSKGSLPKGQAVEQTTFKKYGKDSVIGSKTEERNGKIMVTFVWCKLCAKHKTVILSNPLCKGSAKKSVEAYINGTNCVSKWTIDRHVEGKGHKWALEADARLPEKERLQMNTPGTGSQKTSVTPRIDSALKQSTADGYMKMIKTAYELAMNPTMPLKHFKVLIKCQRQNGVVLMDGRDNNKAAREYIHCIANAIREKCAAVIASKHFMSLMSDGSQARKTGSEKELIMVRCERNGIPCYFIVSLLEMSEYGGVDANSIKKGIDSVFNEENGVIKLSEEDYRNKLVSATTDGASVNTGAYNGILTQLSRTRPWLLTVHCANHRIELAFKSALQKSTLNVCDELYQTIFLLLKNSGKLNNEVYAACKALGIESHKKLPKIQGTRFISHRRKAMKILVDVWPGLIVAFENALASPAGKAETKAKIRGLLTRLQSYEILCKVSSYIDILDAVGPSSLVFEGDGVMPYEIAESLEQTHSGLNELVENAGTAEELIDSYIGKFRYEEQTQKIYGVYIKDGHRRKKPVNRESLNVEMSGLHRSAKAREVAASAKKSTAIGLSALLHERFPEKDSTIYNAMRIYDPQYWGDDAEYGVEELRVLFERFKVPLSEAGVDERALFVEWKRCRIFARRQMGAFLKDAKVLWQRIFTFKRLEYPNICLLVELITCVAGSNSAVERAFSLLTLLLSDRRLSMKHDTMTDLMLIKGNDNAWSAGERKDILHRALEMYMEKRRKVKLDTNTVDDDLETPSKKSRVEKDVDIDNEYMSSGSSSEGESEEDDDVINIDNI